MYGQLTHFETIAPQPKYSFATLLMNWYSHFTIVAIASIHNSADGQVYRAARTLVSSKLH